MTSGRVLAVLALTSLIGCVSDGDAHNGDDGRRDNQADADLKAFGERNPSCQLWTNWQKMCSSLGPQKGLYCKVDPSFLVKPSVPFCADRDRHQFSAEERASILRFCEVPGDNSSVSMRGICARFRHSRPFNGYNLAARLHPYCQEWSDAQTHRVVCRVDGRGAPSCTERARLNSNSGPLFCSRTIEKPPCTLGEYGVVQPAPSDADITVEGPLKYIPTQFPVNGIYCRKDISDVE